MSVYIGVDPGISGAFFAIGSMGCTALAMPTIAVKMTTKTKGGNLKQKNIIAAAAVREWLRQFDRETTEICIELVSPMPAFGKKKRQGIVSMFSFGESFGILQGLFTGMGFKWSRTRPQAWQKVILAGEPKGSEANVAARLFPAVSFRATERSTTPHSGIVDAALIAEFLRRTRVGR